MQAFACLLAYAFVGPLVGVWLSLCELNHELKGRKGGREDGREKEAEERGVGPTRPIPCNI